MSAFGGMNEGMEAIVRDWPLLRRIPWDWSNRSGQIDDVMDAITAVSMPPMAVAMVLAYWSVSRGGGPFGSVIMHRDHVVSYGSNHVTLCQDPTEHGEVNAIRRAVANGHADALQGATLVTSTYPCPMCYGYALDHGIARIEYANTQIDAEVCGGFRDKWLWDCVSAMPCVDALPHRHFMCDGRQLIPTHDTVRGQWLADILRDDARANGLESGWLKWMPTTSLVLCLFDYAALKWARVRMPTHHSVALTSFSTLKTEMVACDEWVDVGRRILQLFRDNAVEGESLYGR